MAAHVPGPVFAMTDYSRGKERRLQHRIDKASDALERIGAHNCFNRYRYSEQATEADIDFRSFDKGTEQRREAQERTRELNREHSRGKSRKVHPRR